MKVLDQQSQLLQASAVLGQPFDRKIKSQPKAPTVMIEGERKDNGYEKQQPQHSVIRDPKY